MTVNERGTSRVGLVLGAGGAAGRAYHAGVLAGIEDVLGWDTHAVDVVVGTSAGAIVGAMLRSGASGREIVSHLRGEAISRDGNSVLDRAGPAPDPPPLLRRLGRPHLTLREMLALARQPASLTTRSLASALMPRGHCQVREHVDWIDRVVAAPWPQQALWVCAVELPSMTRTVWGVEPDSAPPVGRAVAASCAVPGYIAPIEHAGGEYLDGGCHSPTNADVLHDQGLDLVVVSSPMSAAPRARRRRVDLPLRRHHHRMVMREAAELTRDATEVAVFEPTDEVLDVTAPNPMRPTSEVEIMDAARRQVHHELRERHRALARGATPTRAAA